VPSTLLLAYDFPPLTGGIARCLGEIARNYPPGALVVSVGLEPNAETADAASGLSIDRLDVPGHRLRTLGGLRRWSSRAVVLAERHDVRFTWAGNLKPAGYPAHWLGARRGVPYGLMTYGRDVLVLGRQVGHSRLKRALARRLLGGARTIVACSRWTAAALERLRQDLGMAERVDPVRVVPLGADPARFRPSLNTQSVRKTHGLGDGPWLLTVARLEDHKGIETAVQVLAALRSEFPGVGYLIAGTGPARERIEAEAARLGVSERVRLLGQVPESELPALYNLATAYLGLSREVGVEVEGFGLAIAEASACGVPVVAGNSGGIPDAVRDGESGILVNPKAVGEAAAAVGAILGDPSLARRLGAGGRQYVERYLNWGRVVADLRGIESAITSREAPAGR
jgi:phosphatidylinositol alpha-1,6-mannosyltransferase